MGFHTPKQTKQVLDRMNNATNLKWYDSSYCNDGTDSIETEISFHLISIMIPNSFIQDLEEELYNEFLIKDTDSNILLSTTDIDEVIKYINSSIGILQLFIDIKNCVYDDSSVEYPQNYYWVNVNGIYYPLREIDEDEIHDEIREFLYENDNLPNISLDEIWIDTFTDEQLERRDFFMSMFLK
jgi:hypothetical protein